MNFIFDPSLVLYLPLHKLDGGSFMSGDAYGHICTVTGALWTPQGRDLDGVDDDISLPNDIITSGSWSFWSWVNLDAQDDTRSTVFSLNGGRLVAYGGSAPFVNKWGWSGTSNIFGNTAIETGKWVFLGASMNTVGTLVSLYHNGVPDGSGSTTILYPTDFWLGSDRSTRYYFNGKHGESGFHNRVLSASEFQRNYLATKWRYQ